MESNNCVFCKIIEGKIPAEKVYEDKKVLVFLDISPISEGHLLVIPKKHAEDIFDIDKEDLKEIISVAKDIAEKLKKNLSSTGVNIMHASGKDAQQSVSHFHIHLVPRYKEDKLDTWPKSQYKELNLEGVRKRIVR